MKLFLKMSVMMAVLIISHRVFSQGCLFLEFPKRNPIESTEINFSITDLIDNRENRDSIGSYTKRADEESRTLICMEGISIGLKRHFDNYYPQKGNQFILVVEKLNISNSQKNLKEITVDLQLVFCITKYDTLKNVWRYENKTITTFKGRPEKLITNLLTAIDEAFKQVPGIDWNQNYPDYKLPDRTKEYFPPIFSCDSLNFGLFTSRQALLQNAPLSMDLFRTKIVNKKKIVMTKSEGRKVENREYVAFCNGENIYINSRSYRSSWNSYTTSHCVVEIFGRGRYFVWIDDLVDKSEAVAGALFGTLGALASSNLNVFVWDTTTDEIFELDSIRLNRILGEYPDLLEQYNSTPNHNNTMIWMDMIIKYDELWLKDKGLKGIPIK